MTTATVQNNMTVGQLVVEKPSRSRVFERLGIDYCCGGNVPLEQACRAKGLDLAKVLNELDAATEPAEPQRDWSAATLTELCDHIEATHHAWLRSELPRLAMLAVKVAQAHGQNHPEMRQVQETLGHLIEELSQHMMKEEQILFPLCRQLDGATARPPMHCGRIENPIRVMVQEHQDAGDALARFRQLTNDYTAPADVCNTFRALLDGLQALELDLHQHIHKENNILFPRAIEAEAALS